MPVWTTEFINNLPDSSFAFIQPSGKKDKDGKTTPRGLRHLPYKDAAGNVDLPHVRDALSRLPETKAVPDSKKKAIQTMLENALKSAQKKASDNMKGQTFRVRTIIRIAADSNGDLPKELQVFPAGSYNTVPYGPMDFNQATLQQFADNFEAGAARNDVPIDVDHEGSGHGGAAAGWLTRKSEGGGGLEARADGLWAKDPKWNSLGKQLVGDDQYRYISPEWSFNYQDPQNSTQHGAVLVAASLVNKPLFRNMNQSSIQKASEDGRLFAADEKGNEIDPLTGNPTIMLLFSQEDKPMPVTNAEILKKSIADRSAEEIKQLTEATDLTAEETAQLEKEKTDADEAAKKVADKEAEDAKAKKEKEDTDAAEKAKKDKEAEDAKTASDKGGKTLTAAEYKQFQANNAKLAKMEAAEKIDKFKAHEKGGKLLPKSIPLAVDFLLSASEAQQGAFIKFIESLPDQKLVAGEAGDKGENDSLTAADQITKLIEDVKKSDPKISKMKGSAQEIAAQDKVQKANAELWKSYKEEQRAK